MRHGEALVVMRLIDMHRVHPSQDDSRSCSRCGERVGIYPSSQAALKAHPGMAIVCSVCALKDVRPTDKHVMAAGSFEEIVQEARDSQDVGAA
jgi:hypothetical protein